MERAYPMASRTRSHAINEVAAAAARESLLNRRMWCAPAKHDASPTMQAIRAIGKKVEVTPLPAHIAKHHH